MNLSALRNRRIPFLLAAAAIVCLGTAAAYAWGFSAHEMVTRQAVRLLPDEVKAFFLANMDALAAFTDEPDVITAQKAEEGPNHFLNIDEFGVAPFAAYPLFESELVEKFGKDALKAGRLPWAAADEYKALVEAFRAKDGEGILRHAGHLSHYVSDATMPLHATKNYKGQLSGNVILPDRSADRHVHVRFEIGMVDANSAEIEKLVSARAGGVHTIADPAAEVIQEVRNSYPLAACLLAADREALKAGEAVTPAYCKRMYDMVGGIAVDQMAYAVGETASFIRSAYDEAGRPRLAAETVALKTAPLSREIVLNREKPNTEKTK